MSTATDAHDPSARDYADTSPEDWGGKLERREHVGSIAGTGRAGHGRGQEHRPRHRTHAWRATAPRCWSTDATTARRSTSVVKEIEAAGGKAQAAMGDVSDPAIAPKLAKQAEALGGVDILVSNAGLRRQTSFLDMSFEEWREILSVALDGAFLLGKAFVPQMVAKGQGGAFVAMSGISTHIGTPNRCHVSASKSGLEGLMRALAIELAPHRITCNALSPGCDRHRARCFGGSRAAQPHQSADPAQALRHGRRDRRHGPPAGRPGRHLHHRPDHPRERR